MRIINNMMVNNFLINLNKNFSRLDDIQYKMVIGKKICYFLDDFVIIVRLLRFRIDVFEIEQFQKNVDDVIFWVDIIESVFVDINESFQWVREFVVRGVNGINIKEDMVQIVKEVVQIKQYIIQVGNINYVGRYIFFGFKIDIVLLNLDGFFLDIGGFILFGGYLIDLLIGNNIIQFEFMKVNYIGINKIVNQIFYIQGEVDENKGNLFKVLDNLINVLESGDVNIVNLFLSDIDRYIDNVVVQCGDVGVFQNRFEFIKNRLSDDNVNFIILFLNNEDVDMVEIIMQFKIVENVYRVVF